MVLMLSGLRIIGFEKEVELISGRWSDFLALAGYQAGPEYQRCYNRRTLQSIAEIAHQSVVAMGCRVVSPMTSDVVHDAINNAWEQFWADPLSYPGWETSVLYKLRTQLSSVST
jgi:hypothetical protein